MRDIPRGVLSEKLQAHIAGRRLKSLVFLTYSYDPGWFEQNILPVFLDLPLANLTAVRLLQLEGVLAREVDHVTVYYDSSAIVAGSESSKLDVASIPIRYPTGCFHPKNVFALVEDREADKNGERQERLIVATLSANLTRSGWWENVEACHIEEMTAGALSGFRDDLLRLIKRVKATAASEVGHSALDAVRDFAMRTVSRENQSTGGVFHTRLYTGPESVPEFLESASGGRLVGLNLEVISPFFDNTSKASPLAALRERFHPREVRVFLPRDRAGAALCKPEFFDAIAAFAGTHWGQLAGDFLRMGSSKDAADRYVHAKVYRFFDRAQGREFIFVGSVNLTNSAHSKGGNFESGFLVDAQPTSPPGWWLSKDGDRPSFSVEVIDGEMPIGSGHALSVRYNWETDSAEAYWAKTERSPALGVTSPQGTALFDLASLPAQEWMRLDPSCAAAIKESLVSTSFLKVIIPGDEPAVILVREDGMTHKPSLLTTLSADKILESWALLTAEQQAAFLEQRAEEMPDAIRELGLVARATKLGETPSMFGTFAGIFHAFACLDRAVRAALDGKKDREAVHRLFGVKYDSLRHLMERVIEHEPEGDPTTHYVMLLCAKQLLREVQRAHPEFARARRKDYAKLESKLDHLEVLRASIELERPEDRDAFFAWFDRWFLEPAGTAEAE